MISTTEYRNQIIENNTEPRRHKTAFKVDEQSKASTSIEFPRFLPVTVCLSTLNDAHQ